MSLVGQLQASRENKYSLSRRDRGLGFLITTPIASKDSPTVLEPIKEHFIAKFGVPRETITDNGKESYSHMFKAFTERLGIKRKHTMAYHPQSNGFIES